MWWTKVGHGTAKFFHENVLYKIFYHLTKYQDQNFISPDIEEFDVISFSIYHQSTYSMTPAMGKKGKRGKG